MSEVQTDAERWARIAIARCQARGPRGADVGPEDFVAELTRCGVPEPAARRAWARLVASGELYRTRTGWRLRTPTVISRHAAHEQTLALYRSA